MASAGIRRRTATRTVVLGLTATPAPATTEVRNNPPLFQRPPFAFTVARQHGCSGL